VVASRIKICGISRVEDALYAEQLGVDTMGLVFYDKSPRAVTLDQAIKIIEPLGGMMGVVALFCNATTEHVKTVLKELPLLIPQFHGDETAAYCEEFSRPYFKAFAMGGEAPATAEQIDAYKSASAVLLDANARGQMGGTGEVFDWSRIPQTLAKPLILAGGLNPVNISTALAKIKPYAVDVSSGVESRRGIKDQALMKQFVKNVRGDNGE
jgi:phosphoribosylanthranilate isomerase